MNSPVITFLEDNYYHKASDLEIERNLVYYASEAGDQMGFESYDELLEAVRRSMELCQATGFPITTNFRRIFICSQNGLIFDWKVSVLAYHLVKLNGGPCNNRVAKLQIDILKNYYH